LRAPAPAIGDPARADDQTAAASRPGCPAVTGGAAMTSRAQAPARTRAIGRDDAQANAARAASANVRGERRLALLLCAPAVLVMLAVAAWPIIYSIWLSLLRFDLRFPQE